MTSAYPILTAGLALGIHIIQVIRLRNTWPTSDSHAESVRETWDNGWSSRFDYAEVLLSEEDDIFFFNIKWMNTFWNSVRVHRYV